MMSDSAQRESQSSLDVSLYKRPMAHGVDCLNQGSRDAEC